MHARLSLLQSAAAAGGEKNLITRDWVVVMRVFLLMIRVLENKSNKRNRIVRGKNRINLGGNNEFWDMFVNANAVALNEKI